MRLIEPTKKQAEIDLKEIKDIEDVKMVFDRTTTQIKHFLQIGHTEDLAEDSLMTRFMRGLDNSYCMLYKLQLEPKGAVFPPILIGPPGVILVNISHAKGFFRAKGSEWFEMSQKGNTFEPALPNLITQSVDFAQKLSDTLDERGKAHPDIIPVLLFANPGVHVETDDPAIRIALMDGMDSLIDNIIKSDEVLQPAEVSTLSETLEIMVNPDKAFAIGEGEDFFGKDLIEQDQKPPLTLPEIPIPTEIPMQPVEEKLQFSRGQWIILGVLTTLTIIILLGAILFAMGIL